MLLLPWWLLWWLMLLLFARGDGFNRPRRGSNHVWQKFFFVAVSFHAVVAVATLVFPRRTKGFGAAPSMVAVAIAVAIAASFEIHHHGLHRVGGWLYLRWMYGL